MVLDIASDDEVRRQFDALVARARASPPTARIVGVQLADGSQGGERTDPGGRRTRGSDRWGSSSAWAGSESNSTTTLGWRYRRSTRRSSAACSRRPRSTRCSRGTANLPRANLELLEKTLLDFSQLLLDFPQIREIDINPLLLSPSKVQVLDARVLIDKELALREHDLRPHLVISPYPKKYQTRWKMNNGEEVLFRPIKPEDEPLWLEMFKGFSEESIRYRFFQVIKDTPHEVRVRYCNIDYDREIAIVPELTRDGKRRILGVCRLSLEPDRKSGELAIIVTDEFQGLGLGTKLADLVLDIAYDMGVEKVYSLMLTDNYRARSLMKRMGFELKFADDGTVEATLELRAEPAAGVPASKGSGAGSQDGSIARTSSTIRSVEKTPPAGGPTG